MEQITIHLFLGTFTEAYWYAPSRCSCWGNTHSISIKRTHLKNKVGSKKAIV